MSPYSTTEITRQEFHIPVGYGRCVSQKMLESYAAHCVLSLIQ